MAEQPLAVSPALMIPGHELLVRASRAGGPGGQHVNMTASRIELVWDVAGSGALSDEQRAQLLAALASRLDGEGRLRVVAQEHRSQLQNREAARARLSAMVAAALRPRKKRKATKPSRASKERRLESKRRRSAVKRDRRRRPEE